MTYNYTTSIDKNTMAQGVGVDLPISTKQAIEIADKIRGKEVTKVKAYLESVTKMKAAVAMTRFNKDTGHKKGIGPGRYPVKACGEILKLVKSVETNAQYKGLGGKLVLDTIVAQQGRGEWHQGRQRRRRVKRTTVEVVLKEIEPAGKKGTNAKKSTVKTTPKKETVEKKTVTEKKVVEKPKVTEKPKIKPTIEKTPTEIKKPADEKPKAEVKKEVEAKPLQDKPEEKKETAAPKQEAAPKKAETEKKDDQK